MATNITRDLERFIDEQMNAGRYDDCGQVLRELSKILTPQAFAELASLRLRREIARADEDSTYFPAEEVFEELETDLKAMFPELVDH